MGRIISYTILSQPTFRTIQRLSVIGRTQIRTVEVKG